MNNYLRTVRLVAGIILTLASLLGTPFGVYVSKAQSWNFEGGNNHGFSFLTVNPATPATDDPTIAGDESLTGAGGPNGLPAAGLAWSIGAPNQFNGLKPAVLEGNHTNASGLLDYTLNGQPIPAGVNARGQSNYLNTYGLNQWGDGLNSSNNDQIARSPNVVLGTNAVLVAWAYGGGVGTHAPVLDGAGYTDGSSGIAVRSAADNSLLASVLINGQGTLRAHGIPLSAFAGQTVYIDVVDAFQGGFGWLAVDEILFTNNTINLDTNSITFEAEDFNFDNGQFIDNPVLSLTPTDTNTYYRKGSGLGVEGVDFHETGNPNQHFIDVEWRFDGVGGSANLPQTTNSFDAVRPAYVTAGVPDFDLTTNSVGDWCNYTRTFPATNCHLYARVASGVPFLIRVDMVTNPTVTNQTLATRGWFIGNGSTTALYETVPMTDSSGTNLLAVSFDGTPKTLRMTALSGGFVANFYALVPTTNAEYRLPQATVSSPANFSVLPVGALPINATVTDPDSPAGSHTVKFFVDGVEVGQDTTAPYSITNSMTQGQHTLTALAIDPQGLFSLSTPVLVQVGPAEFLYRETFTCPANGVGDKNYNAFGWQVFGVSGQAITLNWVNQGGVGRSNDVNTFTAGPHFDGTFDKSSRGTAYFSTTDVESPSLAFTPEFSLNPADYTPGTLKFSWYQGNANTNSSLRLIIRVGSTWYAHATTFTNSINVALNAFVTNAPLMQVIYDPNPTNWLVLNFDGTYDPVTKVAQNSTVGALNVSAQPAQALSGTITAFGVLGTQPPGGNNNRRFDTFTIEATVPTALVVTSATLSGNQLTLQWSGGTGPYKIQKKTLITDTWADDVTGIAGTSAAVTISLSGGDSGYYQVVGQ